MTITLQLEGRAGGEHPSAMILEKVMQRVEKGVVVAVAIGPQLLKWSGALAYHHRVHRVCETLPFSLAPPSSYSHGVELKVCYIAPRAYVLSIYLYSPPLLQQ